MKQPFKIMLTGKDGQVGWELLRTLAPAGRIAAFGKKELDLADEAAVREAVRRVEPNLIVNAAAYTAVDKAESERDLAFAVNATAVGAMAEEAKKIDASMVHYSTDYVFDGKKSSPYTEDDATNPLGVYGASKLAGEKALEAVGGDYVIFRTCWVYGMRGKNFLLTMRRLAAERDELRVVDDQIGSPTWSRMIAEATAQVVAASGGRFGSLSGIYNLSCAGSTSWAGFARAIVGEKPKVTPISTAEYPTPAARPQYSVLSGEKIGRIFGVCAPPWDEALSMCLEG